MTSSRPRRGAPPGRPTAILGLAILSLLAVAQPLWELLSKNAEFLIAHRVGRIDVLVLVAALLLIPPLILCLLVFLAKALSARLGQTVLWAVSTLSAMAIALPILDRLEIAGGAVAVTLALVIGAAVATFVLHHREARFVVLVLSPALLAVPSYYLLGTPLRQFVLPAKASELTRDGVEDPRNVVIVVLDELPLPSLLTREGSLDSYHFPHIGELAESATWYVNATTVAADTTYAVPAILTGQYPREQKLPTLTDYPDSLLTELVARGVPVSALETHTALCPRACDQELDIRPPLGARLTDISRDLFIVYQHHLLPGALRDRLPAISATWRDFGRQAVPATAESRPRENTRPGSGLARGASPTEITERLAARLGEGEEPRLYFVHYNLPHLPWRYLPSGQEYGPFDAPLLPYGVVAGSWSDDLWAVIQGQQRHLLQLQFADALIGRITEALESEDLYEQAMVILVADHGASFVPGTKRRTPQAETLGEVVSIPLIVKFPGQTRSLIDAEPVTNADIAPTVADVLGFELPWETDGRSLLDSGQRARNMTTYLTNKRGVHGALSYRLEDLLASRRRLLDRNAVRFGVDRSFFDVAPPGLALPLVSYPVVGVSDTLAIELEQPWQFSNVETDGAFIPAHVTGLLHGSRTPSETLLIAINGEPAAWTWSSRLHDGDDHRFSAMVPPGHLRDGMNTVEIFRLLDGSDIPRLERIDRKRRRRVALVAGTTQDRLVIDGRSLDIVDFDGVGATSIARLPLGSKIRGRGCFDADADEVAALFFSRDRLVLESRLEPPSDAPEKVSPCEPGKVLRSFDIRIADVIAGMRLRLILTDGESAWELPVG